MNPNINNQNPNINNQNPPEIDLAATTPIACEKCEKETFIEALMLRQVSALLSKSGRAGIAPLQVFTCVNCGHVNQQFLPPELRKIKLT
jgi:uncharacterized Zn finger protein